MEAGMRRRDFLTSAAAFAAVGGPALTVAQPARARPVVGVLIYSTPDTDPNLHAFVEGLAKLGYVAGQSITLDYRFGDNRPERLPGLAAELVSRKPDVIFALGGEVTTYVAKATQTIPIVYGMSADPVPLGIAASLARPGGNATGVTYLSDVLAGKRLELFTEAAPRLARVGFLHDPSHADNELHVAQAAATRLGVALAPLVLRGPADLDDVLAAAGEASVDGLYIVSSRHTIGNAARVVDYASAKHLPLAGGWGAWVEAGGLISYGPNVPDMVRRAALYVDQILKGAKPGELPVQQPTRFELMVNLRNAKALGLTLSEAFLLRADKVVE